MSQTLEDQDINNDALTLTNALLAETAITKAAELARTGKYREAEAILTRMGEESGLTPPALDLLARIRAQQGRYAEARAPWTAAARQDPDNPIYRRALQRLEKRRGPHWLPIALRGLAAFIFVACLAAAATIILRKISDQTASHQTTDSLNEARNNAGLRRLAAAFRFPGANVRMENDRVTVSFDRGLFVHGANLTGGAKQILGTFCVRLKLFVGHVAVNIEGRTDDIPMPSGRSFPDNEALALRRAAAVADYLRAATGLSAANVTVSGLGAVSPLMPNNTLSNRLRNRTVLIHLCIEEG